jgi:galactokinase
MNGNNTENGGIIEGINNSLLRAGMCSESAQVKAKLFQRSIESLADCRNRSSFGRNIKLFVPGRIEFLGKHTDYAGGRSLVTAIDMGFAVTAMARMDRTIRIINVQQTEAFEFSLDAIPNAEPYSWTIYPLTVARRVVRNFPGPICGADIAFLSDLPPASGLSSSSAFIIALFMALAAVNRLEKHEQYRANIQGPESLAGYLATIENGQSFGSLLGEHGVGTFGGSEDHTAILCSRPGCLVQYRYCPVVHESTIRIPEGTAFAVAFSGVIADKNSPETQIKYNLKSRLAARIIELWREATGRCNPHLAAILESNPNAADLLDDIIRSSPPGVFSHQELIDRMNHFIVENNELVGPAGLALERGDFTVLGELVDRSQYLVDVWLGTQIPETIFLAKAARRLGAHASSSFGAGFGGAVWALVNANSSTDFIAGWQAQYRREFPDAGEKAAFRICQSGPAAFFL